MEIGDFVSGEAPESVLVTSNEQIVDMDCDGKQDNEDDDEEEEDEEDEDEECEFRFEDGVNPLDLMEGGASGVPFYQHLEKLQYEALAEKKRKALADNHGEGSTKKARLEDLSGATMEEIMEAMNFGVRRKSRKYKKKGRRKGSKNKLSPEVTRLLGDATLHYARGNYQEAILLLHRIIMQAPELPETYHTLGLVHNALGDDKKSMDFYMLAAQLTPKDPSLWKVLFTRSIEQGDTGRARYCLMRAITRDPNDVTLKSHLASFYEELGDNQKAAESYEQVWQLCPENVEALKKAVKFYQQCGQAESSISILEDYLKGHPVEADFCVIEMLVTILMENKAHNQALNLIEHAHLVYYSGKELPFYLATKAGICHVHLGNMEKAEILFSVLREEKDCDHCDLIMEAADTFMSHGHFGYALKYYLILEENAAGDHGIRYLKIAKAYLALNVRVEAILFFYRALHVHEDSIDARLTLASLLLEECKEDEAILLLSTPKDSDSKDNQCSDKSKPWWLNENVRLKLSHIYRAKGMLEEFVSTILPLVRESLHIEGLQQQKVKGKKKLSSSELHRRVKLLDEPHRDSVFHGFRPVAPSSELMKASRARRLIQKKSALKQKKKAEAMAAGFDWQSGDSEDEFTRSKRQEIKDPPLPNLLKDDEHLCLLIDLGKALASLKRYWEALEIINLTLRLADNALSPEQKEGLRSLGAQIAYNTTDPKHGFDCVKYIVQQHPTSFGAWNCYYKVASRLDSRYSKHYKFHHRMRARYKDYVPPIIIAGHQFTVKSHHQDAAREYLEAYKLLPENPLVNLCVGTALINLALGFRLQNKHQCLAQGLAFLYNNLRLSESSQEALYNIARAYHHVGLVTLAASYYEKVLAIRQKDYPIPKLPNENLDLVDVLQPGYCDLRRDAAYNLHLIYKKSGAVDLARQVLKDHCTF